MTSSPDRNSRYVNQPGMPATLPDGRQVMLSTPRIAPPGTTTGRYDVQPGDRLDLLAYRLTGNTTSWWRIADVNPWFDAGALEQPGNGIALPHA